MPLFDLRSSRSKSYSKDYQRSLGIPSSKKEIVFSRRSYIESKRKSKEESEEQDGWLLTYSDMVTLLLTFFILMFSFSEVDQAKFEQMKSAITGDLLKREVKKPFEEIEEELTSLIENQSLQQAVQISTNAFGVNIDLASSSLYELGSANIKEEMVPILTQVGKAIQTLNLSDFLIEVEGHTDDIPIKSARYESNWELSSHRATNVVKSLIESGIAPYTLKASGFADSRPVVPNRDEFGQSIPENQEQNRRVVIIVRRNTGFAAQK